MRYILITLTRYLERPKHIEVQILADRFGNCVHLFERDCSVQRKYQKIVELAPAFNLSAQLREAVYNAAIKLAKYTNYGMWLCEAQYTARLMKDGAKLFNF